MRHLEKSKVKKMIEFGKMKHFRSVLQRRTGIWNKRSGIPVTAQHTHLCYLFFIEIKGVLEKMGNIQSSKC